MSMIPGLREATAAFGMRGAAMAYLGILHELRDMQAEIDATADEPIVENGVHRHTDGSWETCYLADGECYSPYHIHDMTVEQIRALPAPALLDLLNAVTPPTDEGFEEGEVVWLEGNERGGKVEHRDFDLPATVHTGHHYEWSQHGKLHREHDLPARVYMDGTLEWWVNGDIHSPRGDLPARIEPSEKRPGEWFCVWYYHGTHTRESYLTTAELDALLPAGMRDLERILHGGPQVWT